MNDIEQLKKKPLSELTYEEQEKIKHSETRGCLKFLFIVSIIIILAMVLFAEILT